MLPINQNLTNVNYNSANKNNKYIVVHYTGNRTDTAWGNTNYFKNKLPAGREASAHYFVDDNSIWQCVLDKDVAWHCGDRLKNGNGGSFYGSCTNYNSIGVEMCCTNYDVSAQTEANTVELVNYLMSKYGIPADRVIRHYDVTNKPCPAPMVNDPNRWASFKSKIGGSYTPTPAPSPSGCTGDITYKVYDNAKRCYLPSVVNDRDYAGNRGNPIGGIKAKCVNGNIYIQAHVIGKPTDQWEETVVLNASNYDSSSPNAYSGIIGRNIDCVKIWSDYGYVLYRTAPVGGNYYSWVDSRNRNNGTSESYAGVYGKPISILQMK